MQPIKQTPATGRNRFWSRCRAFGLAVILCLLPLAAWAHDDDEAPTPIDPQTQRAQLITFGIVGTLVLAGFIFYYVRRRQLMNSDNYQEGFHNDQD